MNHLTDYEIVDYLSDELDEQSGGELLGHLEECQICRDKVEDYRSVIEGAKSVFPPQPAEIFWINYLPNLRERMSHAPAGEAGFLHQLAATFSGGLVVVMTILMLAGGFSADTLELNFESWMADKLYDPVYSEDNFDNAAEDFFEDFNLEYYESSSYYQESYLELFDEITYDQLEAAIEVIAEEKII